MAWIANQFNSWLGSNVTHFANATDDEISVTISEAESKTTKIEFR